MKTRSGFVSNSSSSSFIMMVKKPVDTPKGFYKQVLKCSADDDVVAYMETSDWESGNKTFPSAVSAEMIYHYVDPTKKDYGYDGQLTVEQKIKSEIRDNVSSYIDSDWQTKRYHLRSNFSITRMREVEVDYMQTIQGVKIDFAKLVIKINKSIDTYSKHMAKKNKWMYDNIIVNWHCRKYVRKIVKNIMKKYPYTFVASIADEDGRLGSFLEHDFEWKIPFIKISHH